MKKKVLLTALTLTLVMTGCAQKKLNTAADTNYANSANDGLNLPNGDATQVYQNVDPYGNGSGQYGNGQNGQYTVDGGADSYANQGVQNIYFDSNQYNITADKLSTVSHNAKLFKGNVSSGAKIKIEGHCDASGSDEYNYALGLRRANATKNALRTNGVPASKITLVSMGESAPECATSSSADCYSKNRRVEFKVIK